MNIIVLLSGGLDSTVLLYHLLNEGHKIQALSFQYGQRHARELDFARRVANSAGVQHESVDIGRLLADHKNALTGSTNLPANISPSDDVQSVTVVPGRNLVLSSIAIAHASRRGYEAVALAATSGDNAIYPDCRPRFFETLSEASRQAYGVEVLHPFTDKGKATVIRIGVELDVPFHDTWSCYAGGIKHCGACGACLSRKQAFKVAEVGDPTEYLA